MRQQAGAASATLRHVGGRSLALRCALALTGHLSAVVAFVWLPWATGRNALSGRDFTGPELARLARNLDVFLPSSAGAVSTLLALALYLVPAAAAAGALIAVTAPWSSRPAAALRLSAVAGAVSVAVALACALYLLVGPVAGDVLARVPAAGPAIACGGGVLACAAAWASGQRTEPN